MTARSPSDYARKLVTSLDDLRKQAQLCDVIVNVSGREFGAHRNVLAARSSYFLAMFTSGFREAAENKVNIEGKPEIFESLLDYVYTGKLKISGETAYELLEMACYMQLVDAGEYIASFIQREYILSSHTKQPIPIGDVYKIHEMAGYHDHLKSLVGSSERHMCVYYKKLKSSDVFLQRASVDFFQRFLRLRDLSSKNEEKEVLELVVKWLKYDFENRRDFADSLIRKVRLGLVPEEARIELLDADMLGIPVCKQTLETIAKLQESRSSAYGLAQRYPHLFSTRSMITAPIAITSPEYESTWQSSFRYFDMKGSKQWKPIPTMSGLTWVPSLIAVHGKLYAAGGLEKYMEEISDEFGWSDDWTDDYDDDERRQSRMEYKDDLRLYDPERNCWRVLPSMKKARKPRLVYLNKCIYAIGGVSRSGMAKDVECFDMMQKTWKDIASLPARFGCNSAVACQSSILLYGHYPSELTRVPNEIPKKSGEILVYNPSTDEWQSKFNEPIIDTEHFQLKPVLFVLKGQCYRIAFNYVPRNPKEPYGKAKHTAVVNLLKLRSSRSNAVSAVSLGEEIKQDLVPANHLGAFRIGENVFVTVKGVVHQTDLKLKEDQDTDIEFDKLRTLDRISDLGWDSDCSNTITFTFDSKK